MTAIRRRRATAAVSTVFARYPRTTLLLGFFVLYLATASYGAQSMDVVAAERPAWALAAHGTLDLSALPHRDLPWYFVHDGGLYSDRFPGAIFFLVPAYWLAGLLGLTQFSFLPGAVTAALVSASAVVVLREVLSEAGLTSRGATVGAGFIGLGTGAWSVAAHAPWSHTFNLLLISLGLLAMSKSRWAVAGLVLGLGVTVRPTLAVGIAITGVAASGLLRSARPAVLLALGSVPGVGLLFAYNGLLFGRWGPSNGHELAGEIGLRLSDLPLNLAGAILSPSRGLLIFYPILLLAAAVFLPAWRRSAGWEKAAFLGGLAVLLTQLSLNRYSGGDTFFGPRLVIEPLTFATPLLAHAVVAFAARHGSRLVRWFMLAGVVLHGAGGFLVHWKTGS